MMRPHQFAAGAGQQQYGRPRPRSPRATGTSLTGLLGAGDLLTLQRAVGNRAVDRLLGEPGRGPVHDVLRSTGRPLPTPVRAEMEARLGHDFSEVRVHTDAVADTAARALHAHAYTSGPHVVFQRGSFDTGSHQGKTILAHELTHVVQQQRGPVAATPVGGGIALSDPSDRFERAADATAQKVMAAPPAHDLLAQHTGPPAAAASVQRALATVVQTKLAGTRAAVEEWSGKASRKGRLARGIYTAILRTLGAYETVEAAVLQKRQLPEKMKQKMLAMLTTIEGLVSRWLDRHGRITHEDAKNRALEAAMDQNTTLDKTADEQRSHALIMLKPRLANEKRELNSADYLSRAAWTDETRTAGKDNAFGGGVNRLDYVEHGDDKGVFVQDRAWDLAGTAGKDLGIPDVDANAGARSVAMSKLAELFDTDVIAKTEFAVHKSATDRKEQQLPEAKTKLGVRQALAPGKEAAETAATITAAERTSPDQITLADPKLQQSLNIIQIIDAIAGQLDRHWHNYYIATDGSGKVSGVVGIDLDMAFAVDHSTVDPTPVASDGGKVTKANFVGIPELVDEAFAAKIQRITPNDVAQALEGLITAAELTATLRRYHLVREAVLNIDRKNIIRDWNANTAERQQDEQTSYSGKMRAGLIADQFEKPAVDRLDRVCKDLGIDDTQYVKKFVIADTLLRRVDEQVLTPAEGLHVVNWMTTDLSTEQAWLSALDDFQQRKDAAGAKVARIREGLRPVREDKERLALQIPGLEKKVEEGTGDAGLLVKLKKELADREKEYRRGNEKINRINSASWDKRFRRERDGWLAELMDGYTAYFVQRTRAKGKDARPTKKKGKRPKRLEKLAEKMVA